MVPFFPCPQVLAACCPDGPPHAAGDSGLHADAVRHVLQHVDLSRGRCGLCPWLFHLISSPGPDVMVWTGQILKKNDMAWILNGETT